jgi:hypothetical protein
VITDRVRLPKGGVEIVHLGVRRFGSIGAMMVHMRHHLHRILISAAAVAVPGGGTLAPVASAATVGQTVKVTAKRAYVDNKAPGRVFSGTIFKGNRFTIDRIARVTHGTAKGLWYHGTATVTGEHARNSKGEITPFKITGWVKAAAFA